MRDLNMPSHLWFGEGLVLAGEPVSKQRFGRFGDGLTNTRIRKITRNVL